MDFNRILHRSFELTRSYRALWLFGFLFALTSARGGGSSGGGGGGGSSSIGSPAGMASKVVFSLTDLSPEAVWVITTGIIVLALLLSVAFILTRVVSETAMIRMVDRAEATGEQVGIVAGFRLGWSRAALRIFVVDLLLFLGALAGILVLLAVAGSPFLLWFTRIEALQITGAILTAVLTIPVIMLIITGLILLQVLTEFFHRAIVLENQDVFSALRRGWQVAWMHAGSTLLMALILFAISLGAALVMLPLFLVVAGIGAMVAGLPGFLAGLVSWLIAGGESAWLVGAAVALPLFVVLVCIPMIFASGLVQVFLSSAWTLTYRELTQ